MTTPVITRPHEVPSPVGADCIRPLRHRSQWLGVGRIFSSSVLALIASVLFLEGYFRLAGVGGQEFLRPDLQMGCRHIPGKQVIWRLEGYSDDKLSSVGLRDTEHTIAKEPGVYRIVLLGDSVVEALQVGLNDTFGKVLESLLNQQLSQGKVSKIKRFEVINFGCSSYSTGQEVLQYEKEAEKYQPDAVVLLYNKGDSIENTVTAKFRKQLEPRPYFYLDRSGQLKEDDSILKIGANKLKPQPVREWLREHSTIYGAFSQADLSLSINEPRYRKIKSWINRLCEWGFGGVVGSSQQRAGQSPPLRIQRLGADSNGQNGLQRSGVDSNGGLAGELIYPDPDNMAVTKALIGRLALQTAAKKRTFILGIFPNINKEPTLSEQAKELKELAANKQFTCLDLSPSFLADPDPTSTFIQYHFSKKGHQIVARELSGLNHFI